VTSLLRRADAAAPLGDADLPSVQRLLDADPITNAVVSSRLRAAGSLDPRRLGGTLLGVRSQGAVVAACYSGGNLVPVGGAADDLVRIADLAARRPRVATSVVGPADAVAAMWPVLAPFWNAPRELRPRQPLLVLRGEPLRDGDPAVRRVRLTDIDRYVPAAAAMFTEELGISPERSAGPAAFRARVIDLVRSGRAYARFDDAGEVMFKADFGAVTPHTVQVQGVWVRPGLRGRGIGTAAVAAVLRFALRVAPTVSLYVNDFNGPARRVYTKLGMRRHGTLSTVLL
jgi:predicted GNAT family acetyltransferase